MPLFLQARSIPNYSNPLNIHMRLQWPNAGGYCGETSAQVTALLNGAWVSQGAWCAAGGGPSSSAGQLLLSANLEDALTVMGLTWKRWDKTLRAQSLASDGQPQYSSFTVRDITARRSATIRFSISMFGTEKRRWFSPKFPWQMA